MLIPLGQSLAAVLHVWVILDNFLSFEEVFKEFRTVSVVIFSQFEVIWDDSCVILNNIV